MKTWKMFLSVFNARNKEFYRDTGTLAWAVLFPVLIVIGFSTIFSSDKQNVFKVAYQVAQPEQASYLKTPHIEFVAVTDLAGTMDKLKRHQYDLIVAQESPKADVRYWINSTSPKGHLVERILRGSVDDPARLHKEAVEGREIRYVDWLIAGLLAMNMMFSALFGVGYTIVRYRKNGVLKRFKATPLSAAVFLFAQIISRLIVIMVVTTFVFFGTNAMVHFQMLGSYLTLFIVLMSGAMCLIALGLLIAAKIRSEEFAGGLLNVISWPMMFLSGVWFSLEGSPDWVQKAALVFPLTHVIDASRAIMTEGAGMAQIGWHVAVLLVLTVVFLAAGALAFEWE